MISHCDLDLCFLDDYWCWTYFHIHACYLYVFFKDMPIQVLCPFFFNLGCFPFGIQLYNFQILTLYQMYGLKFFHFVLLLLSCFSHVPTLCDPIEGSPPGSAIPGILQAKTLEWVPFPSPMHESEKWKWCCSVVSNSLRPHGLHPTRLLHPRDFPGKSTGVGCYCPLHPLCELPINFDDFLCFAAFQFAVILLFYTSLNF